MMMAAYDSALKLNECLTKKNGNTHTRARTHTHTCVCSVCVCIYIYRETNQMMMAAYPSALSLKNAS